VTDSPDLQWWVFDCMGDLAAAKRSAADFAISVRKLYDVLVKKTGDPAAVRECIDFHLRFGSRPRPRAIPKASLKKSLPKRGRFRMRKRMKWDRISAKHRELALKLLPKPPRRKRGRPKGAFGGDAYNKRHDLYRDWIYEKTLNPSLTQKQFAKKRLGITDEELEGEYGIDHHAKLHALLQELKPARMKQLDEGHRRALEILFPLVITGERIALYHKWRNAKQADPALTEGQFVMDDMGITDKQLKAHPRLSDFVRDTIVRLEQGRKLSSGNEGG
jgi:hypothetical protein